MLNWLLRRLFGGKRHVYVSPVELARTHHAWLADELRGWQNPTLSWERLTAHLTRILAFATEPMDTQALHIWERNTLKMTVQGR